MNSAGVLYATWLSKGRYYDTSIKLRGGDLSGPIAWEERVPIDVEGLANPTIHVDETGRIHLLYYDRDQRTIQYMTRPPR